MNRPSIAAHDGVALCIHAHSQIRASICNGICAAMEGSSSGCGSHCLVTHILHTESLRQQAGCGCRHSLDGSLFCGPGWAHSAVCIHPSKLVPHAVYCCTERLAGIGLISYLHYHVAELHRGSSEPVLLLGSMGASAVLVYNANKSPLAQVSSVDQ